MKNQNNEEHVYYNGTKLLSLKDINGSTPEIFISVSNRNAGKTTYFNRLLLNRFKKLGKKFVVLYRFNYELDDCGNKFFKTVNNLFFPSDNFEDKRRANGMYHEFFMNDKSCGYAITLNSADQVKRCSHLFCDTDAIIFDEFQSESNHYCNDEITKFMSIHTSLARGENKQVKYLPVYMLSNTVSLINPYYVALGISDRLKSDTKYLRGDGFVLEANFNENASKLQQESAFNKAFKNTTYQSYTTQNIYLNDNTAFIDTLNGKNSYMCTIKFNGSNFGIREYTDMGIIYCDSSADTTFPFKISVTTGDHNINYVMLKKNDVFISNLRWYFEKGCFRFKNLECKEAVLHLLSY